MGKTIINGIEYAGNGANDASQLPYDNTMSTKEKIDELNTNISELNSNFGLINGDLGGQGVGNYMAYDKHTKIFSVNVCIQSVLPNGFLLATAPVTPATNRAIWFIAHNVDGTTSNAQLLVKTNGEVIIANSVDVSMNAPIINGSCYLG